MGPRTTYTPGTFSWVDLATTDAAAARSFYTALFGWETEDTDAGDGSVYTICRVGDDAVCALYEMSNGVRRTGAPPCWTSYVTVDRVDDAVARARELGGALISDAFDVLDAGRMAVVEDPLGAAVAVWQPRARIGAERVNDVGCLCMNELATSDVDAARSFYEPLFGWTTERIDTGPGGPVMLAVYNHGNLNATLSEDRNGPPHWRPYFTVESTEAAVARARDLGAQLLLEPIAIPDGSIAIALDPHGALFALFEGRVDP
jgi:predicted enzyme related to lactoylglutathione lyase